MKVCKIQSLFFDYKNYTFVLVVGRKKFYEIEVLKLKGRKRNVNVEISKKDLRDR